MTNRDSGGRVGRRSFVRGSALAVVGLAAPRLSSSALLAFSDRQHDDAPNQHNMLVVGEQTVFLSHLPMFQGGAPGAPALDAAGTEFTSPHRFQVILEAAFTNRGKSVAGIYVNDRQAHPNTRTYTLEPDTEDPFVLTHLFTPAGRAERRSFTATVFRGHLEQGGRPIAGLDPSLVEITRVVHARKLDPRNKPPAELEYILFGKGKELFLAHSIFAPPDFDQVFSIELGGRELSATDLNRDLRVIVPGRKNAAAARLREGQTISAMLTIPGDQAAAATPVTVKTSVEWYFEEGELLAPATFEQTPEELKER
jgi:hypothetical protein